MATQLELDTELVAYVRFAKPACIEPSTPFGDVLAKMQTGRRGSIAICEKERLVGIVTERDIVRLMANRTPLDTPISKLMTRSPKTIRADQTVSEAIEVMSRGGYRRLPVVDDEGRPIGTLKVSHILRFLVEHFPAVVYNLPPKPHLRTHEREGA